ncbi:hypothetical protein GCM10009111_28450 [Colwellia asteriadis]|uniref:Lipoprotein n=1 Tax=Colwellia asteriadis TaxID=517723 RepID=A0ABN1L9Q4_9GAMM
MLKNKSLLSSAVLVAGLSACSSNAVEPVPAILPADSSEARAEIIDIVSNALGGKKVPIAQDVFQESSRLLLGPKPVTATNGVTVYDSNPAPVLVFELIKRGDNCLIRRLDTMETWPLTTQLCVKREVIK